MQATSVLHELLEGFTKPNHPVLKFPVVINAYRGDGTQTGERRLKAMLGDRYESLHHDTIASDGQVVIFLPRFKAPNAVEAPWDFRIGKAEHHWAMTQVEERHPDVHHASPETIQRVPVELAQRLHALPDLEFVDVEFVHYWESGSGKSKRKKKPALQDMVYFRFTGGYGIIACP